MAMTRFPRRERFDDALLMFGGGRIRSSSRDRGSGRASLITTAPGCSRPSSAWPSRPRVSGVNGVWIDRVSVRRSSSSRLAALPYPPLNPRKDSSVEEQGFEPSVPPQGKQDYSRLPRSSVQDRPFGKSDRLLLQKEPGSASRRHSKEAARVRGDRPPWTDQRSAISIGNSGVARRLA